MHSLARKMLPLEIATEPARIVHHETRSVRKVPVNFDEADIGLFKHELSVSIPATRLLELKDVNISSEGIIFSAGRILAESFNYRHEFVRWANSGNLLRFFVRNYALKTRRRFDSHAIWITDNWGCAYFHWLLDALPRLYVIRDQLEEITLLLPESFKSAGYVLPSLAPFPLRAIQYIGLNEVSHCRQLSVPSHTAPSGHYNESVIRGLRELYRSYYGPTESVNSVDKIYISRSKAKKRRIINESRVMEVVKEQGFSVVCFEEYPFAEQVRMMLNARYVVSNHGAGLTNMLFLPEKSHVLELRKIGDSHCNCYFALASGLNLQYYYQLCKAENPDEDAGSANVFVDLKLFRKNLELMLAAN